MEHSSFFAALPYFPFGVLDAQGRPWATLLCSPSTEVVDPETLRVRAALPAGDPFGKALLSTSGAPAYTRLFAGVGVDFSNRRRNKLNGYVRSAVLTPGGVSLELTTTENMGNCPKYITVHKLEPHAREPSPPVALGRRLDADARALLEACSTLFIASRHLDEETTADSDMGFNHRGGPPGFVRYMEDGAGVGHLVLPDYSGNQLFQTLGNIQTDPLVGLVLLDFATGDTLHVTGRARNVFGAEAEALMPRAPTVTDIVLDEAVLIRRSLQLRLSGPESFSPYNPPLKLLASELAALGRPLVAASDTTARLVAITRECSTISTFTFALSSPADVPPGGYAIFDFKDVLHIGYQHMNQAQPRTVNDDLVRTWTVSRKAADNLSLAVTVKHQPRGLISTILHGLPLSLEGVEMQIKLKGFGGGMSCFADDGSLPQQTWLAAGVGITPFLALLRHLASEPGRQFSATLLYSCRGDEALMAREFADDPRVRVLVFDSTAAAASVPGLEVLPRRVTAQDVAAVPSVAGSRALLCGPESYQSSMRAWLGQAGVTQIITESFNF